MIAKLECFSGHCQIAPDQRSLAGYSQFGRSFVIDFERFLLLFLEIKTPIPFILTPYFIKFS